MNILETERLLLREFVPDDVDALAAVLSDPETMRYYPAVLIAPESPHGSNATGSAMPITATGCGPWC